MVFGLLKSGCVAALAVVTASGLAAQAVPSQLGLAEREAQESFLGSVVAGYPQWGAAGKAFVALPASVRVAVVQGGVAWARAYVKSPAFRTAYENARAGAKPTAPEAAGSVDDELKRQVDAQLEDLAEMRKALASLPPEQRKELEEALRQSEAQLKDPQMLAMMRSGIEADRASARETYQADLRQWEENYPVNPDLIIRRRLQAFLTECGDVDFSAKLQSQYGMMRFVNPEYEQKPNTWKTCFRAGPEAMGAARTAVTAWLAELPGK